MKITDTIPLWLLNALAVASSSVPATNASGSATSAEACTVTEFSGIPSAVAACTNIILRDITVPGHSTLDLSALKTGTKVTFAGFTTWEYYNANYDLIKVSGTDIEITAEPDAIIDGNGQAWWDGLGSNGGIAKPNHFITVSKVLGSSFIHNLYIQNYPVHCFAVSGSNGLTIHDITLNNTAGEAPNNRSNGLPASHNSDGFGFATTENTILRDSVVYNQDDCVAVTSGNNITVSGMYCDGSHGLSIGSIGGKSSNTVTNIHFSNSTVTNSENGLRIKSNFNTTGLVSNITYTSILLSNISIYGIDIQQDYLNGGPTGTPSNGVKISGVVMSDIRGTMAPGVARARDYYILCGQGSCDGLRLDDVKITGGMTQSSCNVGWEGDFDCDGFGPSNGTAGAVRRAMI